MDAKAARPLRRIGPQCRGNGERRMKLWQPPVIINAG